nr:MAG TPA: hypothetical protein [Caudoviricetes sp.]
MNLSGGLPTGSPYAYGRWPFFCGLRPAACELRLFYEEDSHSLVVML